MQKLGFCSRAEAALERLYLRVILSLCSHTAFTLMIACLPADGGDPEMEPELTKESPGKSQKEEEEEEEDEDELDPLMLAKKAKQLARRGMSFNAKETGAKVGTGGLAGFLLSPALYTLKWVGPMDLDGATPCASELQIKVMPWGCQLCHLALASWVHAQRPGTLSSSATMDSGPVRGQSSQHVLLIPALLAALASSCCAQFQKHIYAVLQGKHGGGRGGSSRGGGRSRGKK